MSTARFTPQAVAEIRAQHATRTLDVRAWATAYGVSLETVRRIARGDTYRPVASGPVLPPPQPAGLAGLVIPPTSTPLEAEPDPDEIAASFARLAATQAAQPPSAEALLDELLARGRA